MYKYQKATAKNPHPGRKIPIYLKTIPTFISALGLAILGGVAYPIVSYQLKDLKIFDFTDKGLLSPVYYESSADESSEPIVVNGLDYTKASNWFLGSLQNELFTKPQKADEVPLNIPDTYLMSIPSLGVIDATVSLKDEDLAKHLVQFPQTALPGQYGSPVVFGHSTIPSFFDPQKYTTIFSYLPKVKIGSDIFTKFNGEDYTYRISKIYEVKPNELWVLKQNYSEKTIKVITCVPPGTTLRRLVVEGTLINN